MDTAVYQGICIAYGLCTMCISFLVVLFSKNQAQKEAGVEDVVISSNDAILGTYNIIYPVINLCQSIV